MSVMSNTANRIAMPFQARKAWPLAAVLIDEIRRNLSEDKPLGTSGGNGWVAELPVHVLPKEGSVKFHFELGVTIEVQMLELSQHELMLEMEQWVIWGAVVRWHQQDHRLPKNVLRLDVADLERLRQVHYFGGAYLADVTDVTGYVLVERFSTRRPRIHIDPLMEIGNVAAGFTFNRLDLTDRARAVEAAVSYCKRHGYQRYWGFEVAEHPRKRRMMAGEYLTSTTPKVVATYEATESAS